MAVLWYPWFNYSNHVSFFFNYGINMFNFRKVQSRPGVKVSWSPSEWSWLSPTDCCIFSILFYYWVLVCYFPVTCVSFVVLCYFIIYCFTISQCWQLLPICLETLLWNRVLTEVLIFYIWLNISFVQHFFTLCKFVFFCILFLEKICLNFVK